MSAKKRHARKARRTPKAVSYCNVHIKGATVGDFYSVYLNNRSKKTFSGTVTEENFTVTIPGKKLKNILVEIKPQKGEMIRKEALPSQDSDILLKPASQIREINNRKFVTNSIREMLAARRQELLQQN